LISSGETWALARRLTAELGSDDVVFCQNQYVGLPLAAAFGKRGKRPKLFVFCDNITSRRHSHAARMLRFAGSVDAVGVCCSREADFLHRGLKIPQSQIHLILEHVDNRFFSPGPPRGDKTRPVIVGIGLEQRDYQTLAQATHDLDVDVRITGFSRYAPPLSKSFPNPLPANMTRQYYDWPELVQLYRDADIVVSSIFPRRCASGVTTLMEGLCCARPVVATRSPGLSDYLEPNDGLSVVEPCDSGSMRRAIVGLLEHPDKARVQAERGYLLASKRYAFDSAVDRLERLLKSL
jgi:hypothetical protein